MANEFAHNSVGPNCTQAEFEAILGHNANGQAMGDLIVALTATQLARVPLGANGTTPQTSNGNVAFVSGSLIGMTTYTSGSGSHAKNEYAGKLLVMGIGGGGGGGGSRANNAGTAGAGGGSGAMFRRLITAPNDSYAYVVGAGGGGGANTGGIGSAGADTSFDSLGTQNLLAPGGAGGSGQNLASNINWKVLRPGNGGALATGNGSVAGDVFCQGSAGRQAGGGTNMSAGGGAGGGGWSMGAGQGGNANAANSNQSGGAGSKGGGGGGGATASNAVGTLMNATGGAGGDGIIIVWEFA